MRKRLILATVAVLVGALSLGLPMAGSATLGSSPYTMDVLVGPNPLMKSTGMVIYRDDDEHFLYSADTLRNTIFRVDLRSQEVGRISDDLEPAGSVLISPHTLELDEQGFLYVTEWATNSVRRLSRDGAVRQMIAGPFAPPRGLGPGRGFKDEATELEVTTGTTGIAFNSEGRLFVGDSTHDKKFKGGLWEVDPNGLKPAQEIVQGLGMVEDISFAPADPKHAYVTDVYGGRIVVVNVDTGLVARELTGFGHPWGNEYDSYGGRNRLLVTEMRGNLWEVNPETGQRKLLARIDRPGLTSIAIDPSDGDVYVSNGLYGGLYRLDEPARRLVPVLPEGEFAIPTSLNETPPDAALPAGTLWVGDMTAISTLAPNGNVTRNLNFQADDYDKANPNDPHWITPSALQTDKDTVYFPETFFARDGISRLNLKTGIRTFITKPGEVSPYHLRALSDGALLASEQSLATTEGRVVRVDLDKSPATTTTIAGDLMTPGGLRYDRDTNDAYVSEVATGRIWAVNIRSQDRTVVVEGLDAPEGLDLDHAGGLVVVEGEGARRLLRFNLDSCRLATCLPHQAETIAPNLPTKLRGPVPKPLGVDFLADVLVRDNGEIVVTAPEDASILLFRPVK